MGKTPLFRWIGTAALVGFIALCQGPADAQQRRSGGFFDQLFGGGFSQPRFDVEHPQPAVDSSRAPAPRKPETPPTSSIVVMGDSMADWLAYGLEDAFSDTPELGVIRKNKTFSGLIRYEARSDLDWPHVARDILAQEKADYVVMMIGLNDRTAFREAPAPRTPPKGKEQPKDQPKDANKDANKDPNKDANKDPTKEAADTPPQADDAEQSSIVAPEQPRRPGGSNEFRSDRWAELYSKRIDETIAALKSKSVPVFWVGLPAIRGTRSTADVLYLNDLFRARAEKAGITYIDVWDGFVDEGGRYSQQGPDLEGQTRRLRSGDGVHFTKFGARKLAHYVEREIRRLMQNRAVPVALPGPGAMPTPDARPGVAARPLAGPVVPLNVTPTGSEELAGAGAPRQASDPVASRVLAKGEAITSAPGRADDFVWPRGSARVIVEPSSTAPVASAPAAAPAPAPAVASAPAAAPSEQPSAEQPTVQQEPVAQPAQRKGVAGKQQRPPYATTANGTRPVPPQSVRNQQPQRPVARGFDPFGWMR
jgi:hypothetical protein